MLGDDSIKRRTAEIPALIAGDKEPAHFPGGTGAMKSFIKKTMRYPDVASRLGIEGRVIIKAHADTEGVLSDFSVLETTNAIFNDEAMNIVKAMPRFVPAKKDGRQVEDECHIMISFRLNEEKPAGQH
ncbi:MAG: energy transducer TonB [Prevotella sp.]